MTTSSSNYPTKEEILRTPPEYIQNDIKKDTISLVEWKEGNYKGWKEKNANQKYESLKIMIEGLSSNHEKCTIGEAERHYYDPNTKTLHLNIKKPSIISALHEYGHHLYGPSEKDACIYSVWMFKIVFPRVFKEMDFDGHLLKYNGAKD